MGKKRNLYSEFARHYDYIFPENQATTTFLKDVFTSGKILDLGCATGTYALALQGCKRELEGIDIDPEMIKEAIKKADKNPLKPLFRVGDIAKLDYSNKYQGVYSIGNTIVHLPTIAAIAVLMTKIYQALVPGGETVIQIINYDRIIDRGLTELPDLEALGRRFQRRYEFSDDHLVFETALTYDGTTALSQTRLIPLRQSELVEILGNAGFDSIICYGGYDKQPFRKDSSYHLIVRARKPAD